MADDPREPADALAVAAVLDEIGALRLRLSTDLEVAASAVGLDEPVIAAEVLDGVRADLGAFAARTGAVVPRVPHPAADPDPVPVDPGRHRRLRAALPAAPALAAAAALVAVLAGVVPGRGTVPAAPPTTAPDAAAASYAELYRLHERGASPKALERAAHGLHAEIARVMAAASVDPAAAETALLRLAERAGQLEDDDQRTDLRMVLAESQRLLAALESALEAAPAGVPVPAPAPLPAPTLPPAQTLLQPQPPAPTAGQPARAVPPTTEPTGTTPSAEPAVSAESAPSTTTPSTTTPSTKTSPDGWLPDGSTSSRSNPLLGPGSPPAG